MQDDAQQLIAADLGLGDLPPTLQEALVLQFTQVALKAANVAVLEKVPVDKRDEFAKLADANDPVGLKAFLDQAVPGHEEVARAAIEEEKKRFKDFQAAKAV